MGVGLGHAAHAVAGSGNSRGRMGCSGNSGISM